MARVVSIALLVAVVGCGPRALSRDEALKLVAPMIQGRTEVASVPIGDHCQPATLMFSAEWKPESEVFLDSKLANYPAVRQLEERGFVSTSIEKVPRCPGVERTFGDAFLGSWKWAVRLTPQGAAAGVTARMVLARARAVEVTGLTADPQSGLTIAEVKGVWEATEIGKALPFLRSGPSEFLERAAFRLYDDGWRLERQ